VPAVSSEQPPGKTTGTAPAHEPKNPIVEHLQSGMILDYATFLVAAITAIFALFLGVLGIIEYRRFEKLERQLATQGKELHEQRMSLDARVERFKVELQTQEQRLAANQRFLEAVLSHHSMLLVGIVKGFGAALKREEARRLSSLISEAEAALDLFYPDKSEVLKALLRLEQIGADGSISSLVQLRNDINADAEVRIRAQQVLTKVKDRLRTERQRPQMLNPTTPES
jgi:hypothetical protein